MLDMQNKKIIENKRYDNVDDGLESSCCSIKQLKDSPNMCSTACTKNLKRELSCSSTNEIMCAEVFN
jgi:hypothetical protein